VRDILSKLFTYKGQCPTELILKHRAKAVGINSSNVQVHINVIIPLNLSSGLRFNLPNSYRYLFPYFVAATDSNLQEYGLQLLPLFKQFTDPLSITVISAATLRSVMHIITRLS
jgi:hypothetical protein